MLYSYRKKVEKLATISSGTGVMIIIGDASGGFMIIMVDASGDEGMIYGRINCRKEAEKLDDELESH